MVLPILLVSWGCDQGQAQDSPIQGMRVGSVLGQDGAEGYTRAEQVRQFSFPRDHGAHPDYRSEWWYVTSVVQDQQGREYGVQFTIFRQALSPSPQSDNPWQTGQAYMGHLGVSDVENAAHYVRI